MISYLQGKILQKTDKAVILQAGDIGFLVFCSQRTLGKLSVGTGHCPVPTIKQNQKSVKFFCHLSVQEYQMALYGFLDFAELECFERLITVSGVGPRMALSLLNCARPAAIYQAVVSNDKKFLCQAKGVGDKLAQKIIMELQPKLKKVTVGTGRALSLQKDTRALDALMSLGYKKTEAQAALKQVPIKIKNVNQRIKEALRMIGT